MEALFFKTAEDFRDWLVDHHQEGSELWVGFFKKHTGRESLTWPESVDEALCVGWIDGVRKRLDDDRYMIRFTPRKAKSKWSALNIRNMERLLKEDRVLPAGQRIWELRNKETPGYSYEDKHRAKLSSEYRGLLDENAAARKYFEAQAPWYRRGAVHWVMSAKREETQRRRLKSLIDHSAKNEPIPPLRRR